ncbi:PAS domain-containing sensor histidine kinase [Halorubrum cibi]|uniref:histidine kinase n=1 Tax=Halorubrum cibi TaxID=413815 RepID=A0A521E5R6_9EURY|nr:PAS domain-containing sensor histidine kinase [Halorubrum cibi]SMO79247.1 PAS domain S-box-containing protein [Halorubrum cibi]
MASEIDTATELPPEYETLHVGIGLYDSVSGKLLDANDRLSSVLGYPVPTLCEITPNRYTANTYSYSESGFIERLRAAAEGETRQFRWRVKRASGELVWVQFHLSPAGVGGADCVRAEVRDITDHYETTHREELLWRVLRHNLRNDVTALVGYSERIREESDAPTVRDAAETVASRAASVGGLADAVKQLQHAVEDSEANREYRHAGAATEAVIESTAAKYPSADLTLIDRSPMWIHVDRAFEYAISHALENAIVHAETSTPSVTVEIGPSPNTGRVEIDVSDANPRIPDAEVDGLFDPNRRTSTSHGSGLGLFVMKWCIESLGGELDIERGSRGNTVSFYLPPREPGTETSRTE